jgi:DNA-directed RNA polymerase subunit RPC12/RpoP
VRFRIPRPLVFDWFPKRSLAIDRFVKHSDQNPKMPINVQCGDCFQSFQVRDDLIGKTIRCKSCGSLIRVTKNASTDTRPKAQTKKKKVPPQDDDLNDSDNAASIPSPVRRRTKSKAKAGTSLSQVVKCVLEAPWTFLIVGISLGLVATSLLPEKFEAGNHLLVIREVPIGVGYLIVGFVWYVVTGGFSSPKHMSFTEQWKEMGFFERWVCMLKFRLQALVIFALIFGAVQLPNLIGRVLCGAALLAVVVWKARDLRPNEWRPLSLVLIGLAYVVPPLLAIIRDLQR